METTENNFETKKRKRTWNDKGNKKDKIDKMTLMNNRKLDDYVDGYETDETDYEGEGDEDKSEMEKTRTEWVNQWISQTENDIYSGYGFDSEKVPVGTKEHSLILNALARIKEKKGTRRERRRKGNESGTDTEEEEDDWDQDPARTAYFKRKVEREKEKLGDMVLLVDESDDEDSDSEGSAVDYENNLAYREDSLSVMTGEVEGKPVWITTDTGAMIQLMQRDYARSMGFKITELPRAERFNINAPGGGKERVKHQVELTVKIKMSMVHGDEEKIVKEDLVMGEEIMINMSFGLVNDLPVPILWGGGQMRNHAVHDLHEKKLLSFKMENGYRYVTESKSWLATCEEMKALENGKVKKAVRGFLPTPARMANMITGGRTSTNVGAALYPGQDNIVRLARQNARVDEGLNQVDLVNVEAIHQEYGRMITVLSCVNNGEAYIVIRNNVEQMLSLPAGKLVISIKPIISLPICRSTTPEFQEMKRRHEEKDRDSEERDGQESSAPRTSIVWSCQGLTERIKKGDLDGVYKYVKDFSPDMVTFQDVKWRNYEGDNTRIDSMSEDFQYYEMFRTVVEEQYVVYLNLGEKAYGGQVTLIRKQCIQPEISYNFGQETTPYTNGRVMKMVYNSHINYTIMAPFNGVGKIELLERRQRWDKAIGEEMKAVPGEKVKILLGNFHAVLEDSDMSHDPGFWHKQGTRKRLEQRVEEVLDIGDEGFGGTTANERMRFSDWIEEGDLRDASRLDGRPDRLRDFTYRPPGRITDKGLILDYALVSSVIVESGGVESSVVFKSLYDRDPFLGSDHRPKWFSLRANWEEKLEDYRSMEVEKEKREIETAKEDKIEDVLLTSYVLATMFRNNGNDLCPKAKEEKGTEEQIKRSLRILQVTLEREEIEGERVRPEEFPEHLWELVDPKQQGYVRGRFEKFKDDEYREECINKILKELDIKDSEIRHALKWGKGVNKEGREEDIMRAQALANIDIFFFVDKDTAELAKDVEAEINTTDEKPMRCRPRKLSVVQQAFLQAKTGLMERVGKLEESNSQWCHGLVLVAYEERIKSFMDKHGEEAMEKMFMREHEVEVSTFFRLCIDLRMLNSKTIPDIFPLPRIDDLIESIPRKCGRYSISDICDAFFTCNLKKEDRHKTAFKTHDRHLQFAVLPQGFINSPSIFCRMIARTFKGMDRGKFSAYIDDVLNHTEDFDEHLEVQQEMYERLRANRLTLKVAKTHLNQERVKFLGHILTKEGRLPDPKSVEAILDWKDPTTTKEVRSFLGATLYYREYIYQYADMAMPLYELIRKGVIVDQVWDPEKHGEAVRKIKEALTSRPVLMQVDNTKKFRLKVDACRVGRGIGCILEQENEEGKWQPVSYYSSSLNQTERQYSATELECKALHDCIIHYAIYLKHVPHFEVFSDHCALKYMQNSDKASTNGRLMRYLMNLQGYNFSIFYRKGTENCDADAVSRLLRASDKPLFLTEDELRDESGVVSKQTLFKARKLQTQNAKMEKEVEKMLRKLAKVEMREMAEINDRILEEGVENLESESGRQRFYENLQKKGIESSKEVVDETIKGMKEIGGGRSEEGDQEYITNFVKEVYSVGIVERDEGEEERKEGEEKEVDGEDYLYQCHSETTMPTLFINMVENVKRDNRLRSRRIGERYPVKELIKKRGEVRKRVEGMRSNERRGEDEMVNCVKKHNLRKKPIIDYIAEEKIQPNIYHSTVRPKRSKVNAELERKRRLGYQKCEVRDSLLGKEAGQGLFARKEMQGKEEICSYEGVEIGVEQVFGEYGSRDYMWRRQSKMW